MQNAKVETESILNNSLLENPYYKYYNEHHGRLNPKEVFQHVNRNHPELHELRSIYANQFLKEIGLPEIDFSEYEIEEGSSEDAQDTWNMLDPDFNNDNED